MNKSPMAKNKNKHLSKGNADGKGKYNARKSWDEYKEVDRADETDEEESWNDGHPNSTENATVGKNMKKRN